MLSAIVSFEISEAQSMREEVERQLLIILYTGCDVGRLRERASRIMDAADKLNTTTAIKDQLQELHVAKEGHCNEIARHANVVSLAREDQAVTSARLREVKAEFASLEAFIQKLKAEEGDLERWSSSLNLKLP